MLDYKDILNKHYVLKMSAREISRQTGISKSGVLHFFKHSKNVKNWITHFRPE